MWYFPGPLKVKFLFALYSNSTIAQRLRKRSLVAFNSLTNASAFIVLIVTSDCVVDIRILTTWRMKRDGTLDPNKIRYLSKDNKENYILAADYKESLLNG